jgi:hypothetical protein
MAGWFTVTLDTTPPAVTWGTPTGLVAGEELIVPYTVNEPQLIAATLIGPANYHLPMTVTPNDVRVEIPGDWLNGTSRVYVIAQDDVLNTEDYELNVSITGGQEYVPPDEFVGGGHHFTYGPLIGKQFKEIFPGEVHLMREVEIPLAGELSLAKATNEFELQFAAEIKLAQRLELVFKGSRQPSYRLARIAREDDEMLLLT